MRDSGLVGGIVPGALKGGNRCPAGLPRCTSSFRRRDAARDREGRHGSSAGDNGGERRRHFVDEDRELRVRNGYFGAQLESSRGSPAHFGLADRRPFEGPSRLEHAFGRERQRAYQRTTLLTKVAGE